MSQIAVLVATYNGEKYLEEQLDSIFAQTYKNFKIYIVDDCSTDTTLKIIKEYAENFPKQVFYLVNETNIGFVKNFEKLLKLTMEEYIAFCDQDDIWESNKLEIELDELQKLEKKEPNKPCLVHSDLSMIDGSGNLVYPSYFRYRNYKLKPQKDLGHILGPCGIMGNTLLMNKKLKELVLPFPETLDLHDYWIAVNNELFGVRKTINKSLVRYRIHADNISNSDAVLDKKNSSLLSRDLQLPNMETKRKEYLPLLLKKVENQNDRKVLQSYLNYLNFDGSKIFNYINLIRYSLLKRTLLFRVKLLFKLLFTNRYYKV